MQIGLLFSTDPSIGANGFVPLVDDRHLQNAENLTPVIRSDKLGRRRPQALDEVSALLTTEHRDDPRRRGRAGGKGHRRRGRGVPDRQRGVRGPAEVSPEPNGALSRDPERSVWCRRHSARDPHTTGGRAGDGSSRGHRVRRRPPRVPSGSRRCTGPATRLSKPFAASRSRSSEASSRRSWGHPGSGKSTLLHCVAGLDSPTDGHRLGR